MFEGDLLLEWVPASAGWHNISVIVTQVTPHTRHISPTYQAHHAQTNRHTDTRDISL